jgi:hypothetical protein
MMKMNKSYNELITIDSFEERYEYLRLHGIVGEDVFGFNRYVNKQFYTSEPWRTTRPKVIVRDEGCNLACRDRPIAGRIHVHHINPVTLEMLENDDPILYDLNNLICTDDITHRAIHYGDASLLQKDYTPRRPGDTKLW